MSYRLHRGSIGMEIHGKILDPIFIGMLQHHAVTQEEREDIIHLAFEHVGDRSLPTLFKYIGSRRPLEVETLHIEPWGKRQIVTSVEMKGEAGVSWRNNILSGRGELPETTLLRMPGQGARNLVDHPYIPEDLIIHAITQKGMRWEASFYVEPPQMSRSTKRKVEAALKKAS